MKDGFTHVHEVPPPGAAAVDGGQVVAQAAPAFAGGESLEVGLEGGGQFQAPFVIHRGRSIAA